MPNASRQKGDRFERACIAALADLGVKAERVPLSGGAIGGSFEDDLLVDVCGTTRHVECKTRKRAWSDLFGWLNPQHHAHKPYCLFIKADRTDTLVVMDLATFATLAQGIL
jgi:hypothetical protein